jgi:cephalosporin hydroxylase
MDLDSLLSQAHEIGMTQVPNEIKGLAEFVAGIKPHNIMEIGSDRGGTFFLWSQIATGKKISLDLPGGPFSSRGMTLEQNRQIAEAMPTWAEGVHVLRCDSHTPEAVQGVFNILGDEKLDFLFIDGDHTYEGVKKDYFVYRQFVRSSGWIAFHDTNESHYHHHHGCYVGRFWNELRGHKVDINEGNDWAGIGLIQAN